MTDDDKKKPPFRVLTPQERADWLTMIESIQRRPGESVESYLARLKAREENEPP